MRNITLLPIVNGNCVTFEIGNLLIRDPRMKTYDLFVEFGDGSYTSFQSKETDPETDRTTVFSKFTHSYSQLGSYPVKGCFKAIYSDDGDPLYPTIPSIEIKSFTDSPCTSPVTNKLQAPSVLSGPSLLSSHMPKYGEQNVYILNYDQLDFKQGTSNQLILFYNEKGKPYTQWESLPNKALAAHKCRHSESVKLIDTGAVERLDELTAFRSDLPDWREQLDKYQHYVLFEVSEVNGSYKNNIFIDLLGHEELETAIMEEESSGTEKVSMTAYHLLIGDSGLELRDRFDYQSEPLTRFHDPNYIYVSPLVVDPDDIPTTIWTYDLSISNDGQGTASDVKAHVFLETDFFDLSTIIGVETKPFRHDRMELEKDGVSFYWDSIALPGINFPNDNKLTIRFSIQPKSNYVASEKLSAHAEVIMSAGNIKETTLTEEVAVTEIIDADRTRQFRIEDVITNSSNTERTV